MYSVALLISKSTRHYIMLTAVGYESILCVLYLKICKFCPLRYKQSRDFVNAALDQFACLLMLCMPLFALYVKSESKPVYCSLLHVNAVPLSQVIIVSIV